MLRRLRKFLETNGMRISIPDERNFESEAEVIESGLRRTIEGRDGVMCSLVRAVCRFRDAALVTEKKDNFGNALQKELPDLLGEPRKLWRNFCLRTAMTFFTFRDSHLTAPGDCKRRSGWFWVRHWKPDVGGSLG